MNFLHYLKKEDESRQMLLTKLTTSTEIDDEINSIDNHLKSILRKLSQHFLLEANVSKYEMNQMYNLYNSE